MRVTTRFTRRGVPSGYTSVSTTTRTQPPTTVSTRDTLPSRRWVKAREKLSPVTLTIDQGTGKPIVKTTKIDVIDPGESVTVSFEDLGEVQFARQTTVKVDVAPVTGEANKDNNSQQYKVIFTLP